MLNDSPDPSTAVAVDVLLPLALALACIRLISGPTQGDRVVALDVVFSATVVLTASMAMASGWALFLDLGITILMYRFFGRDGLLGCIVLAILLPIFNLNTMVN